MITQWMEDKKPGQFSRVGNELRVTHYDGDVSSLWPREGSLEIPEELRQLQDLYEQCDGADLFSSAFKIAAISESKWRDGVLMVPTLRQLQRESQLLGCHFPEGFVPFMVQAGIGLYAVARDRMLICEWDTDEAAVSGEYGSLSGIFDEWLAAVG